MTRGITSNPLPSSWATLFQSKSKTTSENHLLTTYAEFELEDEEEDDPLIIVDRLLNAAPRLGWFKAEPEKQDDEEEELEDTHLMFDAKNFAFNEVLFDVEDADVGAGASFYSSSSDEDMLADDDLGVLVESDLQNGILPQDSNDSHGGDGQIYDSAFDRRVAFANAWELSRTTAKWLHNRALRVMPPPRILKITRQGQRVDIEYTPKPLPPQFKLAVELPTALDVSMWDEYTRRVVTSAANQIAERLMTRGTILPPKDVPKQLTISTGVRSVSKPSVLAAKRMLRWMDIESAKSDKIERIGAEETDTATAEDFVKIDDFQRMEDVGQIENFVMVEIEKPEAAKIETTKLRSDIDFLPGMDHLAGPMVRSVFFDHSTILQRHKA